MFWLAACGLQKGERDVSLPPDIAVPVKCIMKALEHLGYMLVCAELSGVLGQKLFVVTTSSSNNDIDLCCQNDMFLYCHWVG